MDRNENDKLEMPKFWRKSIIIFSFIASIATIIPFLIPNVYKIKFNFNLTLNWIIFICAMIISTITYLIYYIIILRIHCKKLKEKLEDLENKNKKNNDINKKINKFDKELKKVKEHSIWFESEEEW